MKELKIETWVGAGYWLLATEGLEGIKIEKLARTLQLNKSGFYHYFGSMKHFMRQLGQHHLTVAKSIVEEIKECKSVDPDFLLVIVKNKSFFQVESQLLVRRKVILPGFFDEASNLISSELLPLWRTECSIPNGSVAALNYINILRYFFYARINCRNVDYEFLHNLADEMKQALTRITRGKALHDHH